MQNGPELSDQYLMSQLVMGDHDAFSTLVKRHSQAFFALAYRYCQHQHDAQDIVQNAFIKLWQTPTSWNAEKSEFTTWFYRVIINACHDLHKKQPLVDTVDTQTLETITPTSASELGQLELRQQQALETEALELAIRKLPESQQTAINLVVYTKLPQKQAAEIMGVSIKALESLLVRAKQTLAISVNAWLAEQHRSNANCQKIPSVSKYSKKL